MAGRDSLEDDLVVNSMKFRGEEITRCPKCRKVILDDVPSCPKCGTLFGRLAQSPVSSRRWVAITAIILLAGMVLMWLIPVLTSLGK